MHPRYVSLCRGHPESLRTAADFPESVCSEVIDASMDIGTLGAISPPTVRMGPGEEPRHCKNNSYTSTCVPAKSLALAGT